jgi:hypothetical protein
VSASIITRERKIPLAKSTSIVGGEQGRFDPSMRESGGSFGHASRFAVSRKAGLFRHTAQLGLGILVIDPPKKIKKKEGEPPKF